MTTTAKTQTQGITWTVIALMALAVFINYVDRGNLATAGPQMKDELHLSATQFGILVSAFFWTYTPSIILAGWLAERINAYRTLALGLAIWALATAATGMAGGFVTILVLRLCLGVGESAAFPCSSKLLAQHVPSHRLGMANGLIAVGLALGPAFGTWAGGKLMAQIGWREVFILFGSVSLLWLIPWHLATRKASRLADATSHESAPSFFEILGRRELWGAGLGHFCGNYAFYFVVSWLPLYLVKSRGFSMGQMAQTGGMIYILYAASSLSCGWLCDQWMKSGASANRVRKTAAVSSLLIQAGALTGCALGDAGMSIPFLFIAAVGFGINTATIFAVGQTLAGPRAAGKWVGLQNFMGNFAGIVAPIITGRVVDMTGQFVWAFAIAGGVAFIGSFCWGLVIRRVEPLTWRAA